jgi:hypothetical protein
MTNYVGRTKIRSLVNGSVHGDDLDLIGGNAIRAWLAVCGPWWRQHRGVNVAFAQEPPYQRYLLFAIIEQPPQAEGATTQDQQPPVYQRTGHGTNTTGTVASMPNSAPQELS